MPLFHIIGVSPSNSTFSIAFCFMQNEQEESYIWALWRFVHSDYGVESSHVICSDHMYDITLLSSVFISSSSSSLFSFVVFVRIHSFHRVPSLPWSVVLVRDSIPPESRPSCSAIHGSVLAIGHASGRISFRTLSSTTVVSNSLDLFVPYETTGTYCSCVEDPLR